MSLTVQKGAWNVLPLGCGGLVIGFSRSNDGTMVCRTDVGNAYLWSGVATIASVSDPAQSWIPVITYASLPAGAAAKISGNFGAWEIIISPSNSNVAYMIAGDDEGGTNYSLYYSTSLKTDLKWSKSTTLQKFLNAGSNTDRKVDSPKIAVDPVNPLHILVGLPVSSGKGYALWQSYTGGDSPAAITALGDGTVGNGCAGICFDASSGTTTVSGATVTSRVLAAIGGNDIFETTDGGVTFASTGFATAYGSSNFYVRYAVIDANGTYYVSLGNVAQIWRYKSGAWTNISGSAALDSGFDNHLTLDPNNIGTLYVFGRNGIGIGFKTTNADTGTPPTWVGRTSGQNCTLTAPDYDIGYLNYIFGQGAGAFTYATNALIDPNGVWWWSGNQSIWYFSAPPDYSQNPCNSTAVSFGRGMECTVAQDVYCPVGGTYPIIGVQDLGGALRGTFDQYPKDVYDRYVEYSCEDVSESADGSICIVRATGQGGSAADTSAYSEKLGEDGSWVAPAATPTSLWQATVVGSVSGSTFTVTSVPDGQLIQNNHWLDQNAGAKVTGQTSGTSGKEGIYTLDNASKDGMSGTFSLSKAIQGGQTVAIDKDRWLTCPSGYQQGYVPAFTNNATSLDCAWNFCSGLPDANWMMRSWVFGATSKPFAVGYGSDLGTTWAALGDVTGTIRIFKSTVFGAFSELIPITEVSTTMTGIYLLSVPGRPGELWLTGRWTSISVGSVIGLWHSTDSGASFSLVAPPSGFGIPLALTIGAPRDIGGYPTFYLLCWSAYGTTPRLFEGQWDGSTMEWSVFGPTGTQADLPPVSQMAGFQSIRGDMNVYGRLYAATNQCGYAFYEPHRPSVALAIHA